MITHRDLCCLVVPKGLDTKSTSIEKFITTNPVTCRDGENVEKCERAMQEHQIRRIPIVDSEDRVIGIVSQADMALRDKPARVSKTITETTKPPRPARATRACLERPGSHP